MHGKGIAHDIERGIALCEVAHHHIGRAARGANGFRDRFGPIALGAGVEHDAGTIRGQSPRDCRADPA
ncbi:hypothetical protein GCM10011349_27870 [Novosphingobium indicum]|uniref:Uncharacterized protein n=1 Tax=Novosphingobium indicum TaxID=462949 RepID=A0ABQ2JPM6_9SPHN|nr:hypothetical protein GCM10011349_27870 [Novosphingobium indicum]